MELSFLNGGKPAILLGMSPETVKQALQEIALGIDQGAEGFCIQTEELAPQFREHQSYETIFNAVGDRPIYLTHYRLKNKCQLTEDEIARTMLELADFPQVTICDVTGDQYDPQPGQLTDQPLAVKRQMELIDALHRKGKKVLMSSHIFRYRDGEEVLRVALEQQARGADIVKIVTAADTMEQQLDNIRITQMLKDELKVPFLFLTNGQCKLHRRISMMLGNCMCLCQLNGTALNQPPLADALAFRDHYPW